jgi:hypothetical protein
MIESRSEMAPPSDRPDHRVLAIAKILIGAVAVIGLWHARSYFFLYDDFGLVRMSLATSAPGIFSSREYSFYRPLAFLFTQTQSAFAGWQWPWAYATGSLLVHFVNAWLVARLARRLDLDANVAWTAGAVFLCSAWAGEAYFWASGRFDLLACTGVLVSILLSLRAARADTLSASAMAAVGAGIATGFALLSKEVAIVIPALVMLAYGASVPFSILRRAGSVLSLIVVAAVAASYLSYREQILPGLNGMYGPLGKLFETASLKDTAIAFVVRSLAPPLPAADVSPLLWLPIGAYILGMLALLLHTVVARPRLFAMLAIAFATCLVPVLWVTLELHGAGKSRFLYLPGIWISLGLGIAVRDGFCNRALPMWRQRALQVSWGVVAVGLLPSVSYQALLWHTASSLSRKAIADVQRVAAPQEKVFVPNLPAVLDTGQPVMQSYAFAAYLGARAPQVRARHMKLRPTLKGLQFRGWEDPPGGSPVPLPGEREIRIGIAVADVPSGRVELEGAITTPPTGDVVSGAFKISGWAIDRGFGTGSGIDTLHVWAHPSPGTAGSPTFIGAAKVGEPSPDVEARAGSRFAMAGFSLNVTSLPTGRYQLVVHPHLMATNAFGPAFVVAIEVR